MNQTVELQSISGELITLATLDLDAISLRRARSVGLFMAEAALSGLMIVVMFVVSSQRKRKTTLFWLNIGGLTSMCINGILQSAFFLSIWLSIGVQVAKNYDALAPSDFFNSMGASLMPVFVVGFIEASLVLQTRVIYRSSPFVTTLATVFASLIALAVTSIWFTAAVENCLAISKLEQYGYAGHFAAPYILLTAKMTFALSVIFSSSLFVSKLYFIVRKRHQLGITGFGAMEIIMVMSCQTLFIPAIMMFTGFFVKWEGLSSLSQTFLVISLPLSSIWASARNVEEASVRDKRKPTPLNIFDLARQEENLSPVSDHSSITATMKSSTAEGFNLGYLQAKGDNSDRSPRRDGSMLVR